MICSRLLCLSGISLLILSLGFSNSTYSFSLKSFSPSAWVEATHIKSFGGSEASRYYQEKTHEFLSYLDVKNPEQVKVRRLEISAQLLQSNLAFSKFFGVSLWTGIWLDESRLEKLPEEERLWVVALEAAQYKLNIAVKNVALMQILPWGAGLANVACITASLPLLQLCNTRLSKSLVIATFGLVGARLSLMLYSSLIQQWYSYYKQWERDATLMAARLLVDNGYANVLEKHIQLLAGEENKSLSESRDILTSCWKEWHDRHTEPVVQE